MSIETDVGEAVADPGRLHVLVLIDSLAAGGAQRVAASLCRRLADEGFSVTLATLHAEVPDFFDPGPGVARIRLSRRALNSITDKIGVNVGRLRALRALLRRDRPNVVIAMMTACSVLGLVAARGLQTRIILCERNFPGIKRARLAWSLPRRLLYRHADAHIAQTQEGARWIMRYAAGQNVHVIPNSVTWPIPVAEPVLSPADWLGANRRCVLAVGTKVEQKGFDLLVYAFSLVAREHRDWDLVILGLADDGGEEDRHVTSLRRRAGELGISDRLFMPGMVGNVADWYARAEIFVLSSRYEGFPNVLLEAMAAGCACVSFDCDTGPRDIVVHGVNGLLVPPRDESALAAAISELMGDAGLRARLSGRARDVLRSFSEDTIMSDWHAVIGSVISTHTSPARGVSA